MPYWLSDVIMVPPQNIFTETQQQQQYYPDYGDDRNNINSTCIDHTPGFMIDRLVGYEFYCNRATCLGSDLVVNINPIMAEDESRTNSVNEGGSTSKDARDEDHRDDRWLQLGLSLGGTTTGPTELSLDRVEATRRRSTGLVELDLLPGSSSSSSSIVSSSTQHLMPLTSTFHFSDVRASRFATNGGTGAITRSSSSSPLFLQQYPRTTSFNFPNQTHEITWGSYRPNYPWNSMAASSSLAPPPPIGSYYARSFHHHQSVGMVSNTGSDVRVVDAPRRPHSGIWFGLQASQNQANEPSLPQISKNYLRIKDGRITVRVLMKYVANKLRLNSESEVEITCRGLQLQPYLTLQHVRDNVWNTTEVVTLLPHSSSATDHLMILNYGRSTV